MTKGCRTWAPHNLHDHPMLMVESNFVVLWRQYFILLQVLLIKFVVEFIVHMRIESIAQGENIK